MKIHYQAGDETNRYSYEFTTLCDYHLGRKWDRPNFAFTIVIKDITCLHCLRTLVFDRSFTGAARDEAWATYCALSGRSLSERPRHFIPKKGKP